ncbi:MAG: hypothetical protein WA634_06915 [Silvibacterium sp.]
MQDDLDQILENAVKGYTAVEPSPKLATRILMRAEQTTRPQHGMWFWMVAASLPLAAALALAFVLAGQWALPKPPVTAASLPPPPNIAVRARPQPAEMLAAAPREPVHLHTHAQEIRAARSTARSLPAPYSREELALLNFVQEHPKEAAAIAEAQKRDMAPLRPQPITISHLEIKPLTIAALQ